MGAPGLESIRMVAPRLPPRDIVVVTPQLTVWYVVPMNQFQKKPPVNQGEPADNMPLIKDKCHIKQGHDHKADIKTFFVSVHVMTNLYLLLRLNVHAMFVIAKQ